jgi:hypothetical protein
MKDIRQVLRSKRAQFAQLAKEIQLLEDAERKLQEVSSLLFDGEEEDENAVLAEVDDEGSQPLSMAASASPSISSGPASLAAASAMPSSAEGAAKPRAPRWP